MVRDVRILTARRAYEFRMDELRLSAFTTGPVAQKVIAAFAFRSFDVAQPMPTFGPVTRTLPPGAVFNWGSLSLADGSLAAVRFLHFEQQRIVFDVAGPSSAVDLAFETLGAAIAGVRTPDGYAAIGEPVGIREYSELTVRLFISVADLLPASLRQVYTKAAAGIGESLALSPVPHLGVYPAPAAGNYPGIPAGVDSFRSFTLALRKDSPLDGDVYFSAAPLSTEAHVAYLQEVEEALGR